MDRERIGRIGRAGLELGAGWLAMVGAMAAVRLGLVPVLEATLGLGPDAASAVRRVGLPAAAVLARAACARWVERRASTDLRPRALPTLLGGAAGAGLLALCVLALVLCGVYEPIEVRAPGPAIPGMLAVIAAAATLEEVFYRSLLLGIVEVRWGTGPALAISAVVFAAAHVANGDGSAAETAAILAAGTVFGLLWGLLYVATRNLWVAAAHHACWNAAIALSGVPLSGLRDWQGSAAFEVRTHGPIWLTGGAFGPEGSVVTMLVGALACAALWRWRTPPPRA